MSDARLWHLASHWVGELCVCVSVLQWDFRFPQVGRLVRPDSPYNPLVTYSDL